MAIEPSSEYPGQIDTTDVNYPLGKAKNIVTAGDGTGTPLEKTWLNDLWGFLQDILDRASITASGVPDQVGTSDYSDALDVIYAPFDGDILDITWNPTNYTPATTPTEVTSVDHLTAHLYGIDQLLGNHDARHISGAADEIDGDQIDIDWNPTNYTPATTPTEVTSVDHLTAHLYGIDQFLGGIDWGSWTPSYTGVINVTSIGSIQTHFWIKVGGYALTVGQATVTATAGSAATQWRHDLPAALSTNFTAPSDSQGVCSGNSSAARGMHGRTSADIVNDEINWFARSTDTGTVFVNHIAVFAPD